MVNLAALLACLILFGLAIFQVALALGAPLGKYAWGGYHQVLPVKLRVASAFSVFLYIVFSFLILSKAGVIEVSNNQEFVNKWIWIVTVYFFIGIIMNAVSRSKHERLVMTPLVTILAILFFYVAKS